MLVKKWEKASAHPSIFQEDSVKKSDTFRLARRRGDTSHFCICSHLRDEDSLRILRESMVLSSWDGFACLRSSGCHKNCLTMIRKATIVFDQCGGGSSSVPPFR